MKMEKKPKVSNIKKSGGKYKEKERALKLGQKQM